MRQVDTSITPSITRRTPINKGLVIDVTDVIDVFHCFDSFPASDSQRLLESREVSDSGATFRGFVPVQVTPS